MTTLVRTVPRDGGITVGTVSKGGNYSEDVAANDEVLLTARKHGSAVSITEEDLADTSVNIIQVKQNAWAADYSVFYDNACIGVTGSSNGTTRPHPSIYYQLTQNNTDTGYTANSNITPTGSGGTTYDTLSEALGKAETGRKWSKADAVCIADYAYMKKLRGVKGTDGQPIFQEGAGQGVSTVFGVPIFWTHGARTSAVATSEPEGNPLLVFANKRFLINGKRSGPESQIAPAGSGVGFMSDETKLKMRARRAFNIGHEKAFSIHEDNSGS